MELSKSLAEHRGLGLHWAGEEAPEAIVVTRCLPDVVTCIWYTLFLFIEKYPGFCIMNNESLSWTALFKFITNLASPISSCLC